jgi:hypothetical protein
MTCNTNQINSNLNYNIKLQKITEQVSKIECLPIDICKIISQYAVPKPEGEKKLNILPIYYRAPILRAGLHMPPSLLHFKENNMEQDSKCVIL